MTAVNEDRKRTAYSVSVDARDGVSTGISAADRAHTVRVLVDSATEPYELTRPGSRLPAARRRGRRAAAHRPHRGRRSTWPGWPGCTPAGVLAEVVNDDGTMTRLPGLREFADEHGLTLVSIADLVTYRRRTENLVERIAEAQLPTRHGEFRGRRLPEHRRRDRAPRAGARRPRRRAPTSSSGCTRSA